VLLLGVLTEAVAAQDRQQQEADPAIVGSTDRTAAQGYSHTETLWHLANIDHRRWDVKSDETMRFLHLNGPQFFTHAWVHRSGPISALETDIQEEIGKVSYRVRQRLPSVTY